MTQITLKQFLVRQPNYPSESPTDRYYLNLANLLAVKIAETTDLPEALSQRVALTVTGYFQDIIADGGIWRTFIDEHRRLYGFTLPFYDVAEGYVDYELNHEDIRFLIWYVLAMCDDNLRMLSPLDVRVKTMADAVYPLLEQRYDDAPMPESYRLTDELELKDSSHARRIYELGHWLFLHSYLLTPAYAHTLTAILKDPELNDGSGAKLQKRIEQSMMEDPTGPLALYMSEWVHLLIEGKMPSEKHAEEGDVSCEHPYYTSFVKATGGERIKFVGSYDELNAFFIDVLGWQSGEDHLPQLKDGHDFVLLVDRCKGMLLAKNICRCIKHPANRYYDEAFAREHAIELLTVRGLCPGDLLRYLFKGKNIPDASFSGHDADSAALVARNCDFIARCYLQQYYRGD